MGRDHNSTGGKARIWGIACAALLAAALACTMAACAGKAQEKASEDIYSELAGRTAAVSLTPSSETDPTDLSAPSSAEPVPTPERVSLEALGVPVPEKAVDFPKLREEVNADIYAWIYIPDTAIDYPVLQHPTDNAYYLEYNLDGSKGYPGCIYTENYNKKDFSDPVTVLYGHNMKNGTMFADLHKYEDSKFLTEHPYIYVYTEEGLLAYRIFSACEYTSEHLLYTYDFTDEAVLEGYLQKIKDVRSMNNVTDESVFNGIDRKTWVHEL